MAKKRRRRKSSKKTSRKRKVSTKALNDVLKCVSPSVRKVVKKSIKARAKCS